MIRRIEIDGGDCTYFQHELYCDICRKCFGTYNFFDDAVIAKKEKHIRSVRGEHGRWTDICNDCVKMLTS